MGRRIAASQVTVSASVVRPITWVSVIGTVADATPITSPPAAVKLRVRLLEP